MSHTYHNALDGYDGRQILHDGCSECEHRGKDVGLALSHMDGSTLERAWKRAHDNWGSTGGGYEATGRISEAEYPVLHALWCLQVQLERRGVPIGDLPTSA